MIKLIAIDLDGTLLNSERRISEKNAANIKKAMDKDVKVVVCSGRIFAGAKIFARQISIKEPLIACNGAIIGDLATEEIIYHNSMNVEDCLRVIEICQNEDIYFHVYIGDTMYAERLEYSSLFYWNRNKELPDSEQVDIKLVEDIKQAVKNSEGVILKVVVISEDSEKLKRARKNVCVIDTVDVMSSASNNFEVVNHGVSKAGALKILSKKLGIKKEEILAIGDNENDFSMIDYAGFGVAMGNAEAKIKDIADYITLTNDEDGVAHAIKKFVLS